ncbi:MAG: molybdate ABC transporter permease subunit, partial [Cellulomonas sp.]|nr:molybdate ABC transporter permease subunit [Cellulomonas sp.]
MTGPARSLTRTTAKPPTRPRPVGVTDRTPLPLAVPAAIAVAFLLFPLVGLLLRAPWRTLPQVLADAQALDAL